jgi:choline dehydrogenase-like flavoprotein
VGVCLTGTTVDSATSLKVFEGGRVTGVALADGSVVRANKEVILACGAINTPQLMLVSGIGPRKELEAHNISVKQAGARVLTMDSAVLGLAPFGGSGYGARFSTGFVAAPCH